MSNEAVVPLTRGTSGKPLVRVFLSFAGADKAQACRLWDLLAEATAVDRVYEFDLWRSDEAILVSEEWDARIKEALANAELGVAALSNAFLGSEYIRDIELPALTDAPGKRLIPVLLREVGKHADWRDLKDKQVYGYERPFSHVRTQPERDRWVNALVSQVHRVLGRYGSPEGAQ